MASVTQKVTCRICDLAVHKNSIQKHQRQHNLSTADDRACLRHWDLIMANSLVRAKELQEQLSNVTNEIVSKVSRELVKVGKYEANTTARSTADQQDPQVSPSSLSGSRICVDCSPMLRRPVGEVWDTRLARFVEHYKDYCVNEAGLFLAHSNVRNHTMILNKAIRANPLAEDVTQIFTPSTIDAMLIGKGNVSIQNSTRYDYLLILKVSYNV